jgi:hypothetical protein
MDAYVFICIPDIPLQTSHFRLGAHSRLLLNRPQTNVKALCPYAYPCESERTTLRPQAAGRGTRGGAGAIRDRGESAALGPGAGRPLHRPQMCHLHRDVDGVVPDFHRIQFGRETKNLGTRKSGMLPGDIPPQDFRLSDFHPPSTSPKSCRLNLGGVGREWKLQIYYWLL